MASKFSFPITLKILVAILLIQATGVLLFVVWSRSGSSESALVYASLAVAAAFFAALWLRSMTRNHRVLELLKAEEALMRERDRSRLLAETEKLKITQQVRSQAEKEALRHQFRANLKLMAALGGVGILGLLMLLTQFLSIGLLLLSSSGGAAAGYLLRMRQEVQQRLAQSPVEEKAKSPLRILTASSQSTPPEKTEEGNRT